MEARPMRTRRLEQRERSFHIRAHERRRIGDRVVVMGFGRKVHACIGLREQTVDQLRVANVAVHEIHAILRYAIQVRAIARIGKRVEHGYMHVRLVFDHPVHEIRADEAGSAGNDDVLRYEFGCHIPLQFDSMCQGTYARVKEPRLLWPTYSLAPFCR